MEVINRGGFYNVLITNGTNYYYQTRYGLRKNKPRNYSNPLPFFRIGKKLVPSQNVARVKIFNTAAFFLPIFRTLRRNNVRDRMFTSKTRNELNAGKNFMVFDTKNHRNVIQYYKIKSIAPNQTLMFLNNNKMEKAKLKFETHASTIQKKLKNLVKKRKNKEFKKLVGNRRTAHAA